MRNPLKDQYDSLYASGITFGGGKPVQAVINMTTHLQAGHVLDIGGGDGRNALYLAQRGFKVTAVDLSEVGLAKLQTTAREKGLVIATQVQDVLEEGITNTYDGIISSFVLHHMAHTDATNSIVQAQQHTKQHGAHVIVTFANRGGLYERNSTSDRFYPDERFLRELYASWDIVELSSQEVLTHARNKDGQRMKNDALSLIALQR